MMSRSVRHRRPTSKLLTLLKMTKSHLLVRKQTNVPLKIARVRDQSYRQPIWSDLFSRDHLPIDVIISPELGDTRTTTSAVREG